MHWLLVLLLASSLQAGERRKQLAGHVAVIAINAAATYLDMRSSLAATRHPGVYETSPLLRSSDGKFHTRGIVGIWAITGAVSAAEIVLWRRGSKWQVAPEAFNAALAVQHFRAAQHNSEITKARSIP